MEIIMLPEDLVKMIYSYIPCETLSLTNKFYWTKNYKKTYSNKLQSSYWRYILRSDNCFVFEEYISNSLPYFLKEKKVIYKSQIYPRKLELVNFLINFTFNSQKCKVVLDKIMKSKRLGFKKIRVRLNKWSN